MEFSKHLVYWYLQNRRSLPWRSTSDPYAIWLSEIILQQTRVDQGLPYFNRFIQAYPTVFDLAKATEQEILKLWQGLGYYSRARNLHATARWISEENGGQFPDSATELKKLKGIGDYTAAAIASICYREPVAVVDGNVYRVLSRVLGVFTPINSTAGVKEFKARAQDLLDIENPGDHNQAVMELGAQLCTPKNPDCNGCPVRTLCLAYEQDLITELPVKERKFRIKQRYLNYLVPFTPDNKTLLVKRTSGIWSGLYEFPLIEANRPLTKAALLSQSNFTTQWGEFVTGVRLFNREAIVHKLSHQHLHTQFWLIDLRSSDKQMIPWESVENYPVPRLIDKFLERYWNK